LSEPKLISPMLDNHVMGGPISDHHGVRCYPAMEKDSDKRYIVKIISVPASRVQLDALLLTGACKNEADALSYFKNLADEVEQEVAVLHKLSGLEGFLPYDACQIVPMENEVGYDVYLLSPYRKTLDRHFRKYPMTHLAAVNLGLDMCASLAVCRQAGYLYVDLKPANICISDDQEYRIGDLGFLKLDSLKYASIPDKYRSAYTAPEVADPFAPLNTTMDIYAAGLILYQAYNGGVLPFEGTAPNEVLPPPMYADYEMAEIILKACNPNPEERWQDPIPMGQAIVSYMQRNGVNDTPIVPPIVINDEDQEEVQEQPEEEPAADPMDAVIPEQVYIAECFDAETDEELAQISALLADAPEAETDDEDIASLAFLNAMTNDDTAPGEHAVGGVQYDELTDDVNGMLTQADSLIAHKTPEGVVAPEPIDIPMPEPIVFEPEPDDTDAPDLSDQATQVVPVQMKREARAEEDDEVFDARQPMDKKAANRILTILLVIVLLACLGVGAYLCYNEFYLQSVTEFRLEGSEDELRVYVTSEADASRLTVVCTDTHGTTKSAPVENGCAVFTGLNPNTLYTVKLEVSGFGKLTGDVSDNYTTPVQTNIAAFHAVAGGESGSVILNFTIDGQDADVWTVTYQAEGEPQITESFTGHMYTVRGLHVGKTYRFTLSTNNTLYLVGSNTLEYTVVEPVFAENLTIDSCMDETIQVSWSAPENAQVTQWTVRCYSDNGFDETLVTGELAAAFTGINCADAYTVEVTAEGMSAASRSYITANSVTITDIAVSLAGNNALKLNWTIGETQVAGKWMVIYSVDGSTQQEIIRTDSTSVVITPVVPGATYNFTVQLEDGSTVLGGTAVGETLDSTPFSGYSVTAADMLISMCNPPAASGWSYEDLENSDYVTKFRPGELGGFVLMMTKKYNTSDDPIVILYVIRDENGIPVSWNSNVQTWNSMWSKNYCELTIPAMPADPGVYTIDIYLNGQALHQHNFAIT